jgi:hypothetical protein
MSFQWLTGKIKAGSAGLASAVSIRTWVHRRPLSNRQLLKARPSALRSYLKSCEMRSKVALPERVCCKNTRYSMLDQDRGPEEAGILGQARRFARPRDSGRWRPDEAAVFIAETVAALAGLARRHRPGVLVRLLEMAQMEAGERIRLRSKPKLS